MTLVDFLLQQHLSVLYTDILNRAGGEYFAGRQTHPFKNLREKSCPCDNRTVMQKQENNFMFVRIYLIIFCREVALLQVFNQVEDLTIIVFTFENICMDYSQITAIRYCFLKTKLRQKNKRSRWINKLSHVFPFAVKGFTPFKGQLCSMIRFTSLPFLQFSQNNQQEYRKVAK